MWYAIAESDIRMKGEVDIKVVADLEDSTIKLRFALTHAGEVNVRDAFADYGTRGITLTRPFEATQVGNDLFICGKATEDNGCTMTFISVPSARVPSTWIGLTLIWLPSPVCQIIPISPSKIGQTAEHLKSTSTKLTCTSR